MTHDPLKLLPHYDEEESFDLNELYEQEVGELPPHLNTPPPPKRGLLLRSLDQIEARQVEWLWRGRIPLGMITLLVGSPEAGKSYLTLAIAAYLSRGEQLPGNPCPMDPVESIIIEMEDGIENTVKPRAEKCGAIADRVHITNAVGFRDATGFVSDEFPFSLDDVSYLERELIANPRVRLVVINPLGAVMNGRVNDFREQDVRRELSKLEALARKYNVAIVCVKHFNKRTPEQGGRGLNRISGSIAFGGLSRSVLGVESDGKRRHVVSLKCNVADRPPAVSFEITEDGLTIEGEDLDYFPEGDVPRRETQIENCVTWLRATLKTGRIASTELEVNARDAGFSKRTLERARHEVGVTKSKANVDGRPVWFTSLPDILVTDSVGSGESAENLAA